MIIAQRGGFGSFLGLSGCKSGDNVKNEPSGDNKNTEQVNNDFSSLEQVVENLKAIIQELDNDNSELNAKMLELEQKIIDAKVNGQNNADVINSINAIIKEMQAEIKSIKSKLDSLKNDEEIKNLNTRISKAEAMLAVENACNNYYLSMQVDKVVKIASPNGDIVCERGEYDDFGYYNKELDMVFCSDHGEESFAVGQFQEGSVAEMINYYFEKDDFFLNEEDSLDNRYVFLNEEGSSIVIDVQVGSMTSMSINLDDYNMNVARDSKANYDKLFHKCKQSLKSIELYQNFNDVFNASLNYKYVGVSSLLYDIYGKYEGSGVISGFNASSESTTPAGEKNYSLLGESNQYYLTIDEKKEGV